MEAPLSGKAAVTPGQSARGRRPPPFAPSQGEETMLAWSPEDRSSAPCERSAPRVPASARGESGAEQQQPAVLAGPERAGASTPVHSAA